MQNTWVQSLGWEDPLEKERQPIPVLLPGESHGGRSLVGYNPRDRKELDTAERLHFTSLHFCHSGAEHGTQTKDQATWVSPGNLLEMQILRVFTEAETQGAGSNSLSVHKSSRCFQSPLKLENYGFRNSYNISFLFYCSLQRLLHWLSKAAGMFV